jgi:LmbE family N-acetylglucosaminyl deacetylase
MFEAVYSCTKSFRYPFIRKIYMMETLSETDFALSTKEDSFVPNVFVDISEFLQKKIDIMRVFESEIADHPFPRSLRNIEALATLRGATAGCEYAESFMLLKEIQK